MRIWDKIDTHIFNTYLILGATEVSKIYGKTRRHWEKAMREGKLKCFKTQWGKFTCTKWVEEYISNQEYDM